jgi:hypothetical protein
LARAVHWLRTTRNADGSWTAQHVHNVDSTGLAAAALNGQGVDTHRSIIWLDSQQVRTGPTVGKGASRGALKYQGAFDPSSSIKATADGLLGMVAHGSLATLTENGASANTAVLALAPAKIRHTTVSAGKQESVTGTGFAAGETVTGVLTSRAVSAGSAKADKSGTATLTFTVPASLTDRHTITLTGRASGLTTSASFRVAAPAIAPTTGPSSPSEPPLADTGRDSRQTGAELALGLGLVALGGLALAFGRRRRGMSE